MNGDSEFQVTLYLPYAGKVLRRESTINCLLYKVYQLVLHLFRLRLQADYGCWELRLPFFNYETWRNPGAIPR